MSDDTTVLVDDPVSAEDQCGSIPEVFDASEARSSRETLVSTVGRYFPYFLRENGDSVPEAGSRPFGVVEQRSRYI